MVGNEAAARALYEAELRKNRQLKKLLADQGALLAAGPVAAAEERRPGESPKGGAEHSMVSIADQDHLPLPPQIIKQSKIMVELRGNDRAEIEAAVTERRASGDADAAGATTLYGGLYKEGTTSPSSQRALPQASPRGVARGLRRTSAINESN